MKKIIRIIGLLIFVLLHHQGKTQAQNRAWKFAHVSDTHIGNASSVEDLQRTILDINANQDLEFVVVTGDITEFGSDDELLTAKNLLNGLNKPWYIIPGNHDMNWSESGGNSFKKFFGAETVRFKHNGILFLGTNCGPTMRMGPGQVPRENIVWLDSVLHVTPKETPIIFMNHYPMDSTLNNWYEIIDRLKTRNTQLVICGHGHSNHLLDVEGIPGVMGRSNLRAKDTIGGYNIVTVNVDSIFYNERLPGVLTRPTWTNARLFQHTFNTPAFTRPSYAINQQFGVVKEVWKRQDDSDIGAGTCLTGNLVIVSNTAGWVKAYHQQSGKREWAVKTGGKIYSTPCASSTLVLVASTDHFLYCLERNTGKIRWKYASEKPIVASPVIAKGFVFCGRSDGQFMCVELSTGKLKWAFKDVNGFIEAKPLLYNGKVYFGSWGNQFYALDQKTGNLLWTWTNGSTNRMFSPASCVAVAVGNRLFFVAPDRYMTCLNASTGKVIWRNGDPSIKVRESMGLSADSSLVYVKTMDGKILGISTKAQGMAIAWKGQRSMGYDISPSLVEEHGGLVFALSNSGCIYCYKREDGSLAWIHKITNSLVNPLSFLNDHELIATTMDGCIAHLRF